ncbi:TetR/AcrR family transcriptional regulator C-terminal domain-containing protein [Streptomyces sp. P3]|uniref:TetR/AcrR family transcriptional regulator C-terminal domain-containing protein n=1 Tax=Streptomyces sp. P3 TaxID=2135430 RepID=UPI0020B1447E|nr:TetR/AcrR family transcriptional regulator C-terminal domain-containing protein [Streptomyces sp. P3]
MLTHLLGQAALRVEIACVGLYHGHLVPEDLPGLVDAGRGDAGEYAAPPPPGDPRFGLDHIGRDYACLVARPGTAALCRLIITELPQMPELADIVGTGFAIDRGPFFDRLRDYLDAEAHAGTLDFRSADGQPQSASVVAEQFLGMICSQLLWPQLVRTDFVPPSPTDPAIVDEAVALMLKRYSTGS